MFLFGLGFFSKTAASIPLFDSSSSQTSIGTSLLFSHTCSTASNRLLIVKVVTSGTVTGITYNGVAMTFVNSDLTYSQIATYYYRLVAPATGSNTVAVTIVGGVARNIGFADSYTNVNQTTPLGTGAKTTGAANTSISLNIASAATELVSDVLGIRNVHAGVSINGDQLSDLGILSNISNTAGSSYAVGSAATDMAWIWTGADQCCQIAYPIKPA